MENKIRNINGGGGKYPSMHKHSQTISKMKPKIRIIHIFAPQIIHTDVHNFRQLVQSLTGKPTDRQNYNNKNSKLLATRISQESRRGSVNGCGLRDQTMRMELTNGFLGLDHQSRERLIKEEEQGFYDGEISSGGYLRGLEGFISEFGHFPFFPNWDASHHRQTPEFEDSLFS
ncbi:hypothetical protein K1719_040771 [Acacia pycnantha]|nr:hypothetical protein K1719_040771 [Acacia pycnantha]